MRNLEEQETVPETYENDRPLNYKEVIAEETEHLNQRSGFSKKTMFNALCLSGGGIRSASFCLGVMYGLARKKWLLNFDYLSVVSGGGFAGAFMARRLQYLFSSVEPTRPSVNQHNEIQKTLSSETFSDNHLLHLRRYSNYLTPTLGLFSLDSLTGALIFLRNFLINLLLIGLFAFAAISFINLLVQLPNLLPTGAPIAKNISELCLIGGFLFFIASYSIMLSETPKERLKNKIVATKGKSFLFLQNGLFFAASYLITIYFFINYNNEETLLSKNPSYQFSKIFGVTLIVFLFSALYPMLNDYLGFMPRNKKHNLSQSSVNLRSFLPHIWEGILAAILIIITIYFFNFTKIETLINPWKNQSKWIIILGPLIVAVLHKITQIGLLISISKFSDRELYREWVSRLMAARFQLPLVWGFLSFAILYSPELIELFKEILFSLDWQSEEAESSSAIVSFFKLIAAILGAASPFLALVTANKVEDISQSSSSLRLTILRLLTSSSLIIAATVTSILIISSVVSISNLTIVKKSSPTFISEYNYLKTIKTLKQKLSTEIKKSNSNRTSNICFSNTKETNLKASLSSDSTDKLSGKIFLNWLKKLSLDLEFYDKILMNQQFKSICTAQLNSLQIITEDIAELKREAKSFILAFLIAPILFGAFLYLLSLTIDINRFSAHDIYRNRLVRTFLGAARKPDDRNPDPYTQFDQHDDYLLANASHEFLQPMIQSDASGLENDSSIKAKGPLLIFNAALNSGNSSDLAWQERQSLPFSMSPLHVGSCLLKPKFKTIAGEISDNDTIRKDSKNKKQDGAYRRTEQFGGGLLTGEAMAISGAAFNSAMGHYSSPILTMLTTIFNLRLGVWLGNPTHKISWKKKFPGLAIFPIVREFFGRTTDTDQIINVSDGGHFDNLGLYEMLRRQCKLIVVCDAGADPEYKLSDLGKAVRLAKLDMDQQINVEFGKDHLSELADPNNSRYIGVANISYNTADSVKYGILIYLKAKYIPNLPPQVQSYFSLNPKFPHEPTTDQWFGESQFNAYFELGQHLSTELVSILQNQNLTDSLVSRKKLNKSVLTSLGKAKK